MVFPTHTVAEPVIGATAGAVLIVTLAVVVPEQGPLLKL
jgi:hypothetical protein